MKQVIFFFAFHEMLVLDFFTNSIIMLIANNYLIQKISALYW